MEELRNENTPAVYAFSSLNSSISQFLNSDVDQLAEGSPA